MPLVLVAAPEAIAVIGAILLMLWAVLWIFVKPISELQSRIPVIGGQLAGAITGAIVSIVQWAEGWAKTVGDGMVQLLWVPLQNAAAFVGELLSAIESLAGQVGQVAAQAAGVVGNVADQLAQLWRLLTNVQAMVGAAQGIVRQLQADVSAIIARGIPAAIAAAEAVLHAWVANAITVALAPVNGALRLVPDQISRAVQAAVNPVAGELDVLRRWLADRIGQLTGQLTGVQAVTDAVTAAGLLTLVPAIARELDTLRKECIDPTCEVIGPQLPTLSALGDLATLLIVGGLVGEAVRDPDGTAREVAAGVGAVNTAAAELLDAFAGVKL